MNDNVFLLPYEDVASIPWKGNVADYDTAIHRLGHGHKKFKAINPYFDDKTVLDYVELVIPENPVCVVWTYKGEWVVKLFDQDWNPNEGYHSFEIQKPQLSWSKNEDLDRLMTFENDPMTNYSLSKGDEDYELVWYLDSRFNPLEDKVWALKARPIGKKIKGVKDMGFVCPDIDIELNPHLPDLGIDIDSCCPAFFELAHECAYELDPVFQTPEQRLWVVKFSPRWRKPKDWKWLGTVSPEYHITYNPDLPHLDYDLDYIIPWYDFEYEHVWMLDKRYLNEGEPEIWAFKIKVAAEVVGTKIVDYISPNFQLEINEDLPALQGDLDYAIPWHDFEYEHIWYIDHNGEKVWAAKARAIDNTRGEKEVGMIVPIIDQLDVVFISYQESNADENWNRVLEKAPHAKRVHGVKGIFNAHRAAAKLATTDMFYVVDGDAYLTDQWEFDYQPGIFDRDCSYVWCSQNPVNGLVYENGGVKLFPKNALLKAGKWKTLDMFTGISLKQKSNEQVSCFNNFNTDEFSTWRSAFRECVKLFVINKISAIDTWTKKGKSKKFGQYAIEGARAGINFAKENINDMKLLQKINDYDWLKLEFERIYGR